MKIQDTLRIPSKILGALSSLLLGDYLRNKDGSINKESKKTFPGLLGLVLDFGKGIGRAITNVIKSNADAIATAFWLSLAIGGGAALTVWLWPAALAAVANYTLAGYSIAALVGTEAAVQTAAIGLLGAALSSAAVYTVATVVNVFNFIKNCCTTGAPDDSAEFVNIEIELKQSSSSKALSQLGQGPGQAKGNAINSEPMQTSSVFLSASNAQNKESSLEFTPPPSSAFMRG